MYRRPIVSALVSLSLILGVLPPLACVATAAGKPGYPDRITWAGRSWQVKSSTSRVGPGPNYFSPSTDNVWVDGTGRLHLKITFRNGR